MLAESATIAEEVNLARRSCGRKNVSEGWEGKFMGRINHGPRKSTFAVVLKSHVLLKGFRVRQRKRLPDDKKKRGRREVLKCSGKNIGLVPSDLALVM